ncbi:MAG: hypothetical protein QMD46_10550 [Methanomicrobiales archaeon]|nr:hypothetical protein [Methanomicrobiales archaeon]
MIFWTMYPEFPRLQTLTDPSLQDREGGFYEISPVIQEKDEELAVGVDSS